jgi:ankyrin repeat protein
MAAQRRNPQIVKIMLEAGARPNDAARNGDTALLVASGNGDDEIVGLLLAAKANPDKPGALRETPLLRAVRGGHAAVVKRLIDGKADLGQTDSSGTTALSLAESLRDAQIVEMLKKAGAQ